MKVTSRETEAAERRPKVAERYLNGKRQSEIAEELGVNQATISRDLAALRKEWIKSALIDFNEAKARELTRIDNLESTYWEAWERSLEAFKSKVIKAKGNPRTEEELKTNAEQTLKTEDRNGDPRYLQGVQWCIEQRCKILGVYDTPGQSEDKPFIFKVVYSEGVNNTTKTPAQ